MPTRAKSQVVAVPAASPTTSAAHFADRLAFETDPADVHFDLHHLDGELPFVLVDSRSAEAFRKEHIPGAVNMPWVTINERTAARFEGKLVVTYCASISCNASTKAALALAKHGIHAKEMLGGIEAWKREGYPTLAGGERDPG